MKLERRDLAFITLRAHIYKTLSISYSLGIYTALISTISNYPTSDTWNYYS